MKTSYFYKLLVLSWIVLMVSGCFPDNKTIYDGQLQVEFSPVTDTLDLSDQSAYSTNVQLIGPHQDSAIDVRFEIDSEGTTAVRGVHFNIDGDTVQIPANSSFASIEIQTFPDAFEDESLSVSITLLGDVSGEVKAAQNYKIFTLTLAP